MDNLDSSQLKNRGMMLTFDEAQDKSDSDGSEERFMSNSR